MVSCAVDNALPSIICGDKSRNIYLKNSFLSECPPPIRSGDHQNDIAPDLFVLSNTDAWGQYLETHAILGKLRITRFDKTMGLVQRKASQPKPEETLKLGEEFCFHLDSEISGYAVAFQEYAGKLHPLPLGQDGALATTVEIGGEFLPLDDNGRPEKLSEVTEPQVVRPCRFVKSFVGLDRCQGAVGLSWVSSLIQTLFESRAQ